MESRNSLLTVRRCGGRLALRFLLPLRYCELMLLIGLIYPLFLLCLWKLLEKLSRYPVMQSSKLQSRGILLLHNNFGLTLDFHALRPSPNVYDINFSRFLDGRSSQLVEENVVWVLSAGLHWVDVLVFHVLICQPLFDLLTSTFRLNK